MPNTKHTSGQWNADLMNIIPSVSSDGQPICNLHRTQNQEESVANAKLIAAAPDLLQAIQNVIDDQDLFGKIQPTTLNNIITLRNEQRN